MAELAEVVPPSPSAHAGRDITVEPGAGGVPQTPLVESGGCASRVFADKSNSAER
jgi:hypothetical protein